MPGPDEISAGRAFVETYADNTKLYRGLAEAQAKLEDWGRSVATIGKGLGAIGGAILAPLAAVEVAMGTGLAGATSRLHDSFAALGTSVLKAAGSLSDAMGPQTEKLVNGLSAIVLRAAEWIEKNGDVVQSIVRIAATVASVGAGLYALGKAMQFAGAAAGLFRDTLMGVSKWGPLLGNWIAAAVTPTTLLVGGLLAAGAAALYLGRNTAPVQSLFAAVNKLADGARDVINTVVDDAKTAWDGIGAAISAGDLSAALKVVTTTLHLEWVRFSNAVSGVFQSIAGSWNIVVLNMAKAWVGLETAFVNTLARMQNSFIAWASGPIAKFMLGGGGANTQLSDVQAAAARNPALFGNPYRTGVQGFAFDQRLTGEWLPDRTSPVRDTMLKTMNDAQREAIEAERKIRLGAMGELPGVLKEDNAARKSATEKEIADREEAARKTLANLENQIKAEQDKLGMPANLAAQQKELDAAVKARDAAVAAAKAAEAPQLPGAESSEKLGSVAGTFSASAVGGLGTGSVGERLVTAAERQNKKLEELGEVMANKGAKVIDAILGIKLQAAN